MSRASSPRLQPAWESPSRWTEMSHVRCLLQMLPPWPKPETKWKKMMQRTVTAGWGRPSTVIVLHSQWKNKQIEIKCLYQHKFLLLWFSFHVNEAGITLKKKKSKVLNCHFHETETFDRLQTGYLHMEKEIKDAKKLRQLSSEGNILVTKITASAEKAEAAWCSDTSAATCWNSGKCLRLSNMFSESDLLCSICSQPV